MIKPTTKEQQLITAVWHHYHTAGRHTLPWRKTTDPYRIVVSEIMLQQTQVSRVIPKYQAFLRRFPSTKQLAEAPLADVLGQWQGLGYNRRAKLLLQAAQTVRQQYQGRWPRSEVSLRSLPGIGIYTARAVLAFAYNQPALPLETNIKTALLVHLFPTDIEVSEAQLYKALEQIIDKDKPREWYWALMDYGATLKQTYPYIHRRVRGYRIQSQFRDSNREIRGAILRELHNQTKVTEQQLLHCLEFAPERIMVQLQALAKEGLVEPAPQTKSWQLPR